MAWADYDTNTSTGDDHAAFAGVTKNRTDALRNHHLGSSAPASPVEGDLWFDNTSSTRFVIKIYENSTWVVLNDKIAEGDRDFDGNEAQDLHLEEIATGSIPAAGASEESRIVWDSTVERAAVLGSARRGYVANCEMDGTTYVRIPCEINANQPATNPATANTATIFGGWTIDAANESLNAVATRPIPDSFTAAHDCRLDVDCLLLVAETSADTIDLDGTWRSLSVTDLPTKTATAFSAASQAITTATQYAYYRVTLTVDHDDASNVMAADDLFVATLTHDVAAGANPVAGIVVVGVSLAVPVFNFADEE